MTINAILSMAILSIVSILLIIIFEKIDKELNIKFNKKDLLIILIISISGGFIISTFVGNIVHVSFLMAYLIFESYTDQKTKLVYTSVSSLVIVIEFIIFIHRCLMSAFSFEYYIFLIPLVLFIISRFNGIGIGDVYIYTALCVFYVNTKDFEFISMIFNILLTNIMFLIVTLIKKIVTKDKYKNYPLTLFITISTFIIEVISI